MTGNYWDHIKLAYYEVSIYDGVEVFQHAFQRCPRYIGDLLATHWILSEVGNGGLLQFFLNSTGVLAPEAVQGFERMELTDVAQLVRESMAYFGQPYPREAEERLTLHARQYGYNPDGEAWDPFQHDPFSHIDDQLFELGTKYNETASGVRLNNFDNFYDRMDVYAAQNAP